MKITMRISRIICVVSVPLLMCSLQATEETTLEQIKAEAAARSKYLSMRLPPVSGEAPIANLEGFRSEIEPILNSTCVGCHGPDKQKGKFRIDTLDPDLIHGEDADWWLDVMEVLNNGEMPPRDEDVELSDTDRGKVIDWISEESLVGSDVERSEGGHSSFRRMTRYEFNYALQDLLGLRQDVAGDLPPETVSEDGFRNNSEMLQMTSLQFATYRDIARSALKSATVRGSRPDPVSFAITMDKGGPYYKDWAHENLRVLQLEMDNGLAPGLNEQNHTDNINAFKGIIRDGMESITRPQGGNRERRGGRGRRGGATFLNLETGEAWRRSFPYGFSLWKPADQKPVDPEIQTFVVALPHGGSQQFDLGNYLPDSGMLKIRFRANRSSAEGDSFPSVRLSFGYRPSNNSRHEYVISEEDIAITALPGHPQFYEWLIPMDTLQRNPFLRKSRLGIKPNPSEYVILSNVHQGESHEGATVHIDYIEVTAPFLTEWPPETHRRVFPEQAQSNDEKINARNVLANFMPKAWRRPVSEQELEDRLTLFNEIRPSHDDYQETMIEVLASVLSSPNFSLLDAV